MSRLSFLDLSSLGRVYIAAHSVLVLCLKGVLEVGETLQGLTCLHSIQLTQVKSSTIPMGSLNTSRSDP